MVVCSVEMFMGEKYDLSFKISISHTNAYIVSNLIDGPFLASNSQWLKLDKQVNNRQLMNYRYNLLVHYTCVYLYIPLVFTCTLHSCLLVCYTLVYLYVTLLVTCTLNWCLLVHYTCVYIGVLVQRKDGDQEVTDQRMAMLPGNAEPVAAQGKRVCIKY